LDQDIIDEIISTNRLKFITWLLYSYNCLSQKTLNIQKDFDFISSLNGKSIKFQNIDFNKGLSNSNKTSQRYMTRLYEQQNKERNKLYFKSGSVIWIDNYSKFYKLTRPRR